ncbi:MAG: galE [Nitrospira sp.]|nr:galE [Nitrospira sp.]
MRVLVTGGAGYVGSIVTEALLHHGHAVTVYDNLSKGHRDAVLSAAVFVEADLLDLRALRDVLEGSAFDAVVHMAADSLVGESMVDPSKYYRSNVQAGLALVDMMRLSNVNRMVFSSTAAVYGEPRKQPIEEHDPVQPANPYGETKLTLERALQWYGQAYSLQSISLRYFNAAGASERNGERHDPETHLIPRVLDVAAGKSPVLRVFGDDYPTKDGTCVRDYIHVQDLAEAHVLALQALVDGCAFSSVYNLGGGGGYSIREVLNTAQLVTGRSIPTEIAPRRPGDPPILIASSDRIKKELGWSPIRQRLADIIETAWHWMQNRSSLMA